MDIQGQFLRELWKGRIDSCERIIPDLDGLCDERFPGIIDGHVVRIASALASQLPADKYSDERD